MAAHAAHAPATTALRRTRDLGDNALDLLCRNRRFPPATRFVLEAVEAELLEAARPYRHRRHGGPTPRGHILVFQAVEPQQNDFSPQPVPVGACRGLGSAL